jgi:hypothetical protein
MMPDQVGHDEPLEFPKGQLLSANSDKKIWKIR